MPQTLAALSLVILAACGSAASSLNISALASRDGSSVIECWQLSSIPLEARSAINYDIGNTTTATWSTIEPQTEVGEAWAPTVQLTMVLNGLIRVSAPAPQKSTNSCLLVPAAQQSDVSTTVNTVGYFMPGTLKSSVLIAADLKSTSYNIGHYTEFPSNQATVLLQIPFVDNKIPEHTVLHDGQC